MATFGEQAKAATDQVLAVLGEPVEYVSYPSGSAAAITAYVTRDPVDEFGNGLAGRIRLLVSKTDLASVTLQRDEIRLAPASSGASQPRFAIVRVLGEGPGHFFLEALK